MRTDELAYGYSCKYWSEKRVSPSFYLINFYRKSLHRGVTLRADKGEKDLIYNLEQLFRTSNEKQKHIASSFNT